MVSSYPPNSLMRTALHYWSHLCRRGLALRLSSFPGLQGWQGWGCDSNPGCGTPDSPHGQAHCPSCLSSVAGYLGIYGRGHWSCQKRSSSAQCGWQIIYSLLFEEESNLLRVKWFSKGKTWQIRIGTYFSLLSYRKSFLNRIQSQNTKISQTLSKWIYIYIHIKHIHLLSRFLLSLQA